MGSNPTPRYFYKSETNMKLTDDEIDRVYRSRGKDLVDKLTPLFRAMKGGWNAAIEQEMVRVAVKHLRKHVSD